jgi:ribose transport system substrate-binding protein
VKHPWVLRGARWAIGVALLGLVPGCGPAADVSGPATAPAGAAAARPRLMFISNDIADWWNAVEKGMRDAGELFSADVELRRNDGKPEGQIRLLEDALSLPDVKGVAVSVLQANSPSIAGKMRELQKAGKFVIAIDSDGQSDARRAYIGTNNRKAGVVAGKAAAALRPDGGKVAIFVGVASAANASERKDGFFEAAGPKFALVDVFEDGGDWNGRARTNVQTAIRNYPDLGVFLGLWSYNAPRIAEELSKFPDLRKKTTVVTFDLDELAVGMLEQGQIDATLCQNPYLMGYLGVRLLKALITKDDKTIREMLPGNTDFIDTGVHVIVPSKDSPIKGENVLDIKEMKAWLESKGLKSS